MSLLLFLVILFLLFGGGFGYVNRNGAYGNTGISLGGILLFLFVVWFLFGHSHFFVN